MNDARLASLSCCPDGTDNHRENLLRFAHQILNAPCFHDTRLNEQFHPIDGLVVLFLNDAHLGDEIGRRSSPARRPVVRTDRGPRAKQLRGEDVACSRFRQRVNEPNDAQRKRLRSSLEFVRVHYNKYTRSDANPQSEIHNPQLTLR